MARSRKSTTISHIRQSDPFREREAAKYDNPLPSREYIEQICGEAGRPMDASELAEALDIREDERDSFARRLGAMERDGQLMRNRRGDYILTDKADLVAGRVEGHADGFGFLVPDDGSSDLFLGPRAMREVLHGDRVLARPAGFDQRGRREGKIVEVLERGTSRLIGRVSVTQGVTTVQPENRRINHRILIAAGGRHKPVDGAVVMVEITQQPSSLSQAIGIIIENLGAYADPGMEIDIALRKHDLPFEFSDAVKAEAKKIPDAVRKKDLADREDIRHLPLVTIDGETAKDFDDAVFCERVGKGFRLIVAIADVSHYVIPGSAIDSEGVNRGNSVYFPRRVIPMLPEKLSNGLCSLNPEVDRLCMVCDAIVTPTGAIKDYKFYPAVMYSHARLTYNKVAAALYEKDAAMRAELAPVLPQLENLDALFRALLKARAKRGAIDFDTVETRMIFDEQGKIERIVPESRNDAHRLIEECMLAANVCASDFLQKHEHPALYRVHEGPNPEKLEKLRRFLAEFGLGLAGGDKPKAGDFAKVVEQIKDRPDAQLIQTVMLRSLQQAVYSPENVGHFGLAYEAYTHFTSPIRRYPDLLVHRAIKAVLTRTRYLPQTGPVELLKDTRRRKGGKKPEPAEARIKAAPAAGLQIWEDIGTHCSMTERRADEASRDVESWLKCYYMQDHVGSEYAGSITSVVPFGIFVTLDELFVEGLIHISDLGKDYFHFDEARHELLGERSGQRFRLSDRVNVQVVRVDLETRKIDFRMLDGEGQAAPTRRTGKTERDAQRTVAPRRVVPVAAPAKSVQAAKPASAKTGPARKTPPVADDDVVSWRDLAGLPAKADVLSAPVKGPRTSSKAGAKAGSQTAPKATTKATAKAVPKATSKQSAPKSAVRQPVVSKAEPRAQRIPDAPRKLQVAALLSAPHGKKTEPVVWSNEAEPLSKLASVAKAIAPRKPVSKPTKAPKTTKPAVVATTAGAKKKPRGVSSAASKKGSRRG